MFRADFGIFTSDVNSASHFVDEAWRELKVGQDMRQTFQKHQGFLDDISCKMDDSVR